MKIAVLHLVTAILAIAPGVAWSQASVTPTGPNRFGSATDSGELPEFLALYDLNDDGQLDNEERHVLQLDRDRHRKFRDRWDSDGNGTISDMERTAARRQIRQTVEAQRERRFSEVDQDKDNFLSMAEFAEIPAVQNSDAASPGVAADLFNHIDADQDGKISLREFLSALDRPESSPDPEHDEAADDRN